MKYSEFMKLTLQKYKTTLKTV